MEISTAALMPKNNFLMSLTLRLSSGTPVSDANYVPRFIFYITINDLHLSQYFGAKLGMNTAATRRVWRAVAVAALNERMA